jgi:hypothetical protein
MAFLKWWPKVKGGYCGSAAVSSSPLNDQIPSKKPSCLRYISESACSTALLGLLWDPERGLQYLFRKLVSRRCGLETGHYKYRGISPACCPFQGIIICQPISIYYGGHRAPAF